MVFRSKKIKLLKPLKSHSRLYPGYCGFFFYWLGIGFLIDFLVEAIFYHEFMQKWQWVLNLLCTAAWAFSLMVNYKYADLRNARKANEKEKREIEYLNKCIAEINSARSQPVSPDKSLKN